MSFTGLVAGAVGLPFSGLVGSRQFGTLLTAVPGIARVTGTSVIAYSGLVLGARAGAFDVTGVAADSGVLSSAVPGAAQNGLPLNFGPGRGRWTPTDLLRLRVEITDGNGLNPSPDLHVAMIRATTAPTVAALPVTPSGFQIDFVPGQTVSTVVVTGSPMPQFGDLVIGIHNRSATGSGIFGFSLRITYDHSVPRGG